MHPLKLNVCQSRMTGVGSVGSEAKRISGSNYNTWLKEVQFTFTNLDRANRIVAATVHSIEPIKVCINIH